MDLQEGTSSSSVIADSREFEVPAEPKTPQRPPAPATSQVSASGSFLASAGSPIKARDQVAEFLLKKRQDGTPLNEIEVEGVLSLLHKAGNGAMPCYFHFPVHACLTVYFINRNV